MIDRIEIKNFKSIVDLKIDLGRINVIIGANGCGKTNILEAFAFASAASQDKLDNEFLANRGIRIPNPQFMKPAFEDIERPRTAEISIYENKSAITDTKVKYDKYNKKWEDVEISSRERLLQSYFNEKISKTDISDKIKMELLKTATNDKILTNEIKNELSKKISMEFSKIVLDEISKEIASTLNKQISKIPDDKKKILLQITKKPTLPHFLIYSPNEHVLRDQNTESLINPLGVHGEGLFAFLKEQSKTDKELFVRLNQGLSLLDWFDNVEIPKNLLSNESKLKIGDRYLKESLHHFDQRSANEGFLYLLFYLTLFNSKETPSFFAVDNIDTSFNPKLCTRLISHLTDVSKEKNKQVLLTTHSPYVLDGLDLSDSEQRLFVARRDIDGHTKIERIPYKKDRNMRLSDLWMSGLIGGLPNNF